MLLFIVCLSVCQWTGKCIGRKTLYSFYGFLLSVGALLCFVVAMVVITAVEGRSVFYPT